MYATTYLLSSGSNVLRLRRRGRFLRGRGVISILIGSAFRLEDEPTMASRCIFFKSGLFNVIALLEIFKIVSINYKVMPFVDVFLVFFMYMKCHRKQVTEFTRTRPNVSS